VGVGVGVGVGAGGCTDPRAADKRSIDRSIFR